MVTKKKKTGIDPRKCGGKRTGPTYRAIYPGHWDTQEFFELSGDAVKIWFWLRMNLGPWGWGKFKHNDCLWFFSPAETYAEGHSLQQREAFMFALEDLHKGGFIQTEGNYIYLVNALALDKGFKFADKTSNHAKGMIKALDWAGPLGLQTLVELFESVNVPYPKDWKKPSKKTLREGPPPVPGKTLGEGPGASPTSKKVDSRKQIVNSTVEQSPYSSSKSRSTDPEAGFLGSNSFVSSTPVIGFASPVDYEYQEDEDAVEEVTDEEWAGVMGKMNQRAKDKSKGETPYDWRSDDIEEENDDS